MRTLRFDGQGLIPGIVQNAATGRVLMLGYLNQEAIAMTRQTGEVHFWSRSRSTLWHKGETSGNTLAVVDIAADCDGDAVLIQATPAGPTCHSGTVSCFGDEADFPQFSILDQLWNTITLRREQRPQGSYTVELLDGGVETVGRKVSEEAVEVLLAAKDHSTGNADSRRVAEEVGDLIYHLLVLMAERNVEPSEVMEVLSRRAR